MNNTNFISHTIFLSFSFDTLSIFRYWLHSLLPTTNLPPLLLPISNLYGAFIYIILILFLIYSQILCTSIHKIYIFTHYYLFNRWPCISEVIKIWCRVKTNGAKIQKQIHSKCNQLLRRMHYMNIVNCT